MAGKSGNAAKKRLQGGRLRGDIAAVAAHKEAKRQEVESPPRLPARLPVVIRPATRRDLNFITHSWNKNARRWDRHYRHCPNELFYHFHDLQVGAILARRNTRALVLCDEEYPEQIVAVCVYELVEGPCLVWHYMYVKDHFRGQGFARAFIRYVTTTEKPVATMFSYMNQQMDIIKNKKKVKDVEDWVYNPFLATHDLNARIS